MNRQMTVYADNMVVGTLLENQGAWSFQYTESWVSHRESYDLSPTLKRQVQPYVDNGTERPVQWFFDNLLPEEDLRAAIANTEGLSATDSWSLLEHFGKESFGSLSFGEPSQQNGLMELTDTVLEQRIKNLPKKPLLADSPKKMSMAGAQHKLLVVYKEGRLYEPIGGEISTHILKPNHPNHDLYPDSVINEYFCMTLAKRIGLPVPDLHLLRVPSPVYIILRFDRLFKDGRVRRAHALDGAQLLSMDARTKYSIDAKAFNRCIELCTEKLQARRQILQWTIFNLLIGNSDAHIKNISFLASSFGLDIAPMYDLLSTASYEIPESDALKSWPDVELSMQVGSSRQYSKISYRDVLEFSGSIGLPEKYTSTLLGEMLTRVRKESAIMEEQFMADESVLASERRRIRIILHTVISEMLDRLKPPGLSKSLRI